MRGMFPIPLAALLLLVLPAVSAGPAGAQPFMQDDGRGIPTIAPLLKRALPAVVSITVVSEPAPGESLPFDPFSLPRQRPQRQVGSGSGVIVDAGNGYILTNNHVVAGGRRVTVTLGDRRRFEARIVGRDPATDIALLQIPAEGLVELPMGDSGRLMVGDFVVAIGNPFGLGQTVTSGIVSALGRSGINPDGYEDFIQTDASINPGNSGGPLITLDGRVVGINTAILAPSGGNVGIGFAVPINMARAVMRQLIETGSVRRGYLGVSVQDLTPEIAEALGLEQSEGALIATVEPGSPAAQAGMRPGDVIRSVNGEEISDANDLRGHIGVIRPGVPLDIGILRSGGSRTLSVTLREREAARKSSRTKLLAGAVLEELPGPRGGQGSGMPDRGVAVREVVPGSPAFMIGLRKGDVILSVNRRRLGGIDALDAEILNAPRGRVVLELWRRGRIVRLLIR